SCYLVVCFGPILHFYRGSEDDPDNPVFVLPDQRTLGSKVRTY
ncbi:unnamed protein product, partial [Choristocarpus tenellus]